MPTLVSAAALATLACLVSEPNSPSEQHAGPAVHDVQPIEVAVRHAELAKLEHVNQNEKRAETARVISAERWTKG